MNAVVAWYEMLFTTVPLPLLEVWGRFAYIVGFFLARVYTRYEIRKRLPGGGPRTK